MHALLFFCNGLAASSDGWFDLLICDQAAVAKDIDKSKTRGKKVPFYSSGSSLLDEALKLVLCAFCCLNFNLPQPVCAKCPNRFFFCHTGDISILSYELCGWLLNIIFKNVFYPKAVFRSSSWALVCVFAQVIHNVVVGLLDYHDMYCQGCDVELTFSCTRAGTAAFGLTVGYIFKAGKLRRPIISEQNL